VAPKQINNTKNTNNTLFGFPDIKMTMATVFLKNKNGFTLLEMAAVLVIIGVIAVSVVGKIFFEDSALIAETEVIKTRLRYAQARAMNTNDIWGVTCNSSFYWIFNNGDTNRAIRPPGEEIKKISLSQKGLSSGPFTISFNSWGKPCMDASGQTLLDTDLVITISGEAESRQVVITKNTGYIP
jgi:prepilin-type N-terminal cleavage/methylation domain-containing protein